MAKWLNENSMLTQRGVEILNKVKAGVGSITVTKILAGSGRTPDSQLYALNSVSGSTKPMTVSDRIAKESGSEISFYISNDGFTESFTLNQIGVYVTHPDYEGEQLYHISQCEPEGADVIPVITETPTTFSYALYLEHSNSSSIEIVVDPQGMVTKKDFDNAISKCVIGLNSYVEYYVDASKGSDTTGDGSSSKPFATIQKAIDITPANLNGKGVRIILKPGAHPGGFNIINKYNGYFIIETDTTSQNKAAVQGDCKVLYCGAKVTLSRLSISSKKTNYDSVVEIDATPNININHCVINGVDRGRSGIHTISGGVNIGVLGCEFFNCNYCISTQHSPDSGGNCSVAVYNCTGSSNNYGFFNEFAEFITYGVTQSNLGVTTSLHRNIGTAGPIYADGALVSNVVANATVEE